MYNINNNNNKKTSSEYRIKKDLIINEINIVSRVGIYNVRGGNNKTV